MEAVVWALSPDPLWGLSPVTQMAILSKELSVVSPKAVQGAGLGMREQFASTSREFASVKPIDLAYSTLLH